MPEYTHPLGDAVKMARYRLEMTQCEVADRADVDARTILNIENYKGNPKLEVLYPLVRTLRIDPWDIFYPELKRENDALRQLRFLIEDCDETEAQALIPVFRSVLGVMRAKDIIVIR